MQVVEKEACKGKEWGTHLSLAHCAQEGWRCGMGVLVVSARACCSWRVLSEEGEVWSRSFIALSWRKRRRAESGCEWSTCVLHAMDGVCAICPRAANRQSAASMAVATAPAGWSLPSHGAPIRALA
jgi:hypothetical protein